jgi:DNA-binding NarL/FixJ family response regulator
MNSHRARSRFSEQKSASAYAVDRAPKGIGSETARRCAELRASGMDNETIAAVLGISRRTVARYLRELRQGSTA